jgi:hypothetical protein
VLTLRLVRGGRPLTLLRRLFTASATAIVSFLLLTALSHALTHPERSAESVARLLWCLIPLAAAVQFAAAAARLDPGSRSRSGLAAAGVGPGRVPLLAALSTAMCGLAGSAAALLVYLQLRGELAGAPFAGAAVEVLAAGRTLPKGAVLTLLCVAPLVAAGAAALATRTPAHVAVYGPGAQDGQDAQDAQDVPGVPDGAGSGAAKAAVPAGTTAPTGSAGAAPTASAASAAPDRNGVAASAGSGVLTADPAVIEPAPGRGNPTSSARTPPPVAARESSVTSGLPWGAALIATGFALETYVGASTRAHSPGAMLSSGAAGLIAGWLLIALGLLLAGPVLTQSCGRLLSAGRPGAVRLLAGRMLAQDALCLGRPLGVLCAVAACGLAAVDVYGSTPQERALVLGPLPVLGAALVVCCVTASALAAAAESRASRAPATGALRRLGASGKLLWCTAALRATALLTVLGPLAWAVGELCAFTLSG